MVGSSTVQGAMSVLGVEGEEPSLAPPTEQAATVCHRMEYSQGEIFWGDIGPSDWTENEGKLNLRYRFNTYNDSTLNISKFLFLKVCSLVRFNSTVNTIR